MCVHQANIIKFRKTIKHRTRKWTQRYYTTMLGARHIGNIANQGQTYLLVSIVGRNTCVINYQFISPNTNKGYFTNLLTRYKRIESITRFRYKILNCFRHTTNITREYFFWYRTVFKKISRAGGIAKIIVSQNFCELFECCDEARPPLSHSFSASMLQQHQTNL